MTNNLEHGSNEEAKWFKIKPALIFLLISMFSYAALSKLFSFGTFQAQMQIQPFPEWIAITLAWALPLLELIAAVLLIFCRTERAGLWISFFLLSQFTGYAGLILFHFWNRTPCSCGGILGKLSWGPHFIFNLFFLLITITGLYINTLERRAGDKT